MVCSGPPTLSCTFRHPLHTIAKGNRQLPSAFRSAIISRTLPSLLPSRLSWPAHPASVWATSFSATLARTSIGRPSPSRSPQSRQSPGAAPASTASAPPVPPGPPAGGGGAPAPPEAGAASAPPPPSGTSSILLVLSVTFCLCFFVKKHRQKVTERTRRMEDVPEGGGGAEAAPASGGAGAPPPPAEGPGGTGGAEAVEAGAAPEDWRDWGDRLGEGLPIDVLAKVAEKLVAQTEAGWAG